MKSWHTDNQAMSVTRDRAGLSRLRLESQATGSPIPWTVTLTVARRHS